MAYQDFIFDRPIGRRSRSQAQAKSAILAGSQRGLAFALEWTGSGLEGDLSFSVANEQVWSTAGTTFDEDLWTRFLAGLAQAWIYVVLEETYPHRLSPEAPSQVAALLEKRFLKIEAAQEEAATFRSKHDVSAWLLPRRSLPSLWLMREGNYMLLEGGGRVVRWAHADVVRTLRELGDHVAQRASNAEIAKSAVDLWHARDAANETVLEQVSMGVSAARLAQLRKELPLRSRAEIFRGLDEVRAAARMLESRVSDTELTDIVTKIRAEPHRDAPMLRAWSERAAHQLESVANDSPRAQGRHIAGWLRQQLQVPERALPEHLLAEWGVAVTPFPTARHIEAISFWGPAHGPAILRNPKSRRSGTWENSYALFGGQRFTLAHELAHLLMDIDGAYPVAEVLGGVLPRAPEERANAFAAEFLLPENIAGSCYQRAATVWDALGDLTSRFGVTKTLAAYQILKRFGENSPVLTHDDFNTLQTIARRRG